MSDMWRFGPAGGIGGTAMEALPTKKSNDDSWKINTVEVWSGSRIDKLELIWKDNSGQTDSSPDLGSGDAGRDSFSVPNGDYLTKVFGSLEKKGQPSLRLFSLQLETKKGVVSKVYGENQDAYPFEFECPDGYHIIGLFGRFVSEVDALGVIVKKI